MKYETTLQQTIFGVSDSHWRHTLAVSSCNLALTLDFLSTLIQSQVQI